MVKEPNRLEEPCPQVTILAPPAEERAAVRVYTLDPTYRVMPQPVLVTDSQDRLASLGL